MKTVAITNTARTEVLAARAEAAPKNCSGPLGLGKVLLPEMLVLAGGATGLIVVEMDGTIGTIVVEMDGTIGTIGVTEEAADTVGFTAELGGTVTVMVTLGMQVVVLGVGGTVTVTVTLATQEELAVEFMPPSRPPGIELGTDVPAVGAAGVGTA